MGTGGGEPEPGPELLTQTYYLCIPFEDFPFSKGDTVQWFDDGDRLEVRTLSFEKRLEVYRNRFDLQIVGLTATVEATGCEGDRLECGAYATDARVAVDVGGEKASLGPGDVLDGANFRLRVGRAERVLAGRDECDAGYRTPGASADFLIAYE